MLLKNRHTWSKSTLWDSRASRNVPVVLNAKTHPATQSATSKARVKLFVDAMKHDNASYCLFTSNCVLKTSRTTGVSLASQIEEFVLKHSLAEETVLAQFADTYYVANLSAGFVASEELISQESFDPIDLMDREIVAVMGVEGASDWELNVLQEELVLSGRRVQKQHHFQSEERAFANAGYTHPRRKSRAAIAAGFLTIAVLGAWAHQISEKRAELKRLEQQAAVIPPKIGSDKSVPQLRMYGDWLQTNLPLYRQFGLRELIFKSTSISLRGETDPKSFATFYQGQRAALIQPTSVEIINGKGAQPSTVNRIEWKLTLDIGRPIPNPNKFGLELYQNYLVVTSAHMTRLGIRSSSAAPRTSEHNIATGVVSMNSTFSSPSIFYDIANAYIGIASFAEHVQLSFAESAEQKHQSLQIRMSITGRG